MSGATVAMHHCSWEGMEAHEAQMTSSTSASDATASESTPASTAASGILVRRHAAGIAGAEYGGARSPIARAIKRTMDIGLAALLLIATAPLCLLTALGIRLTDGGPALFWQRRVGERGREFWFPKFRSMRNGTEDEAATVLRPHADWPHSVTFKMRDDPRITPIGRLIRTLSIDELPQLWCVLRGDMSLVGPRPPLAAEVARYGTEAHCRLTVKPGLTCIWQVSGRSLIPFDGQLALDLQYVREQSLWLDIKLLLRTIPAVLSCKGAY
jgi:lipopolysaccharide/colanic/teichoic acid biosynthesis glycosyltransferase